MPLPDSNVSESLFRSEQELLPSHERKCPICDYYMYETISVHNDKLLCTCETTLQLFSVPYRERIKANRLFSNDIKMQRRHTAYHDLFKLMKYDP